MKLVKKILPILLMMALVITLLPQTVKASVGSEDTLKEYLADSESMIINTETADMDGNGKLNIRDVMKLKELLANN